MKNTAQRPGGLEMNPQIQKILVDDHHRSLLHEAEATRLAAVARQASAASVDGRAGGIGQRFDTVRRFITRLATTRSLPGAA